MSSSRKILFHNSLSTGDLSVIRDETIPEGSLMVELDFDPVGDHPESLFCYGKFKRALFFGAFVSYNSTRSERHADFTSSVDQG